MKNKFILLYITVFTILLVACRKEQGISPNNTCPSGTYIDNYAKSLFFNITNNSYWIYKDSSGNIDSSWASGITDGLLIPGCNENYTFNLSSSILYNDFNITGAVANGYPTLVYIIYNFANSSGHGGDDCFQICFLNGTVDTVFDSIYPAISVETFSSYTVNQYNFSNALKITSKSGCDVHYIVVVPAVGIVEKWNGEGYSAFKLIRYSI